MRVPLMIFAVLLAFSASLNARVDLSGPAVQGGLVTGHAPPGSTLMLDGKPLMISPDGEFVFGIGHDQHETLNLEITLPDGHRWSESITPEIRKYDIQRIDGLPSAQVTPPAEALARIQDDNQLIGQARQRFQPHTDWADGFDWPLIGRISGVYGSQRILNGVPRRPHFGVDIAAPEGTPIRAPAAGVVSMAHPDMYYSGATVLLDHGHGVSTTYLHLSAIEVSAGQRVARGDIIGRVGATGRATGPHLCWRLNWGGVRLDPMLMVPEHDSTARSQTD